MRSLVLLLPLLQIFCLGNGALIGYELVAPDPDPDLDPVALPKIPHAELDQDQLKTLQNLHRHYYSPFAFAIFRNEKFKGRAQLQKLTPKNTLEPDQNVFTRLWVSPWTNLQWLKSFKILG